MKPTRVLRSRVVRNPVCALLAACLTATVLGSVAGLTGCRSGGTSGGGLPTLGLPRLGRPQPRPMCKPVRAVWVARFHYRTAADVREIVERCAQLGCNTVFWQVRGEGTVSYPSKIEPWGREFGFVSPGFDPLALAVQEAHKRGLRIEAWFNVMPGWKGLAPPPMAGQLYNAHPDWFMYDAAGRRQPLNKDYVILNPCRPEVRRYIVSLVDEIVSRYDVDGVHLDYVRYAWDGAKSAKQSYPRDGRTLTLYYRETGKRPDDDAAAWDHWRANQLTRIVDDARATINRRRPGATLTAAVYHTPTEAYELYLQNSVAWLRAGLVDAVMPMAYTDQLVAFDRYLRSYHELAPGRRIVPGVGLFKHQYADQTRDQLSRCQAWGGDLALFSYGSLFPTAEDRLPNTAPADPPALRQMRRDVVTGFLRQ